MRKITIVALMALFAGFGLFGCKKIIKKLFPGLDADVPEIVVTIPFVPLPAGTPVPEGEIAFPAYTQLFNLDSAIRAKTDNQFSANDVASIKVKQVVLTLKNGDQQNNFANFESARVTFSSNANPTPAAIVTLQFPDQFATTSTFDAPANTPELISYLKGTELTYNAYGKLRRYTSKELKLGVVVTLRVK